MPLPSQYQVAQHVRADETVRADQLTCGQLHRLFFFSPCRAVASLGVLWGVKNPCEVGEVEKEPWWFGV